MNDDLAIMDLKDIRDYLIECHYNVEAIEYAIKLLERPKGEWVRKEDVIHSIAKQYSEHNKLVPIWLSIADIGVKDELKTS